MAARKKQCPICKEDIEPGEPTVTLPSGKVVHTACVGR